MFTSFDHLHLCIFTTVLSSCATIYNRSILVLIFTSVASFVPFVRRWKSRVSAWCGESKIIGGWDKISGLELGKGWGKGGKGGKGRLPVPLSSSRSSLLSARMALI